MPSEQACYCEYSLGMKVTYIGGKTWSTWAIEGIYQKRDGKKKRSFTFRNNNDKAIGKQALRGRL
jgi:hypothetical protein